MSQQNLHEVAIGYLLAHQGEHLSHDRARLVKRCADYLREIAVDGCTRAGGELIALQALGEVEARGNAAHIDLRQTTSFTAFVVDPVSRMRFAFTASDLVRMGRDRQRDQQRNERNDELCRCYADPRHRLGAQS